MKQLPFNLLIAICIVQISALADFARSAIIYVDDTAAGANNGLTWPDAYADLQIALTAAEPNDQIRVAAGTYYPSVQLDGTGPRYATYQMKNGVAIYGGYAGTGADPNHRDIQNHQTILSGDIGTPGEPNDNCYHIFYHPAGLNLNQTAVLDGFTLTAGNADGPAKTNHRDGAGIYNNASSPTITNCSFTANSAYFDGGGIYIFQADPIISRCSFTDNLAYFGGGIVVYQGSPLVSECLFLTNTGQSLGGGIYIENSNPTITRCTFRENIAAFGGAIVNYESSSLITNCIFNANRGNSNGGGIWNNFCSPAIINCIFTGNSALYGGGAIRNYYQSDPNIINCTFVGNSAGDGGGIANYNASNPVIANCILWANTAIEGPQIYNDLSTPAVTFCTIQDGFPGDGNKDSDPLFTDPNGPDGILGTDDDDLRLSYLSPCRDSGSNALLATDSADLDNDANTVEATPYDLYNHTRTIDGDCTGTAIVDMGAIEFYPAQTGDLDTNCKIDLLDFYIFAQAWQTDPQDTAWNPVCDLSFPADQSITPADFNILYTHWLAEIQPE